MRSPRSTTPPGQSSAATGRQPTASVPTTVRHGNGSMASSSPTTRSVSPARAISRSATSAVSAGCGARTPPSRVQTTRGVPEASRRSRATAGVGGATTASAATSAPPPTQAAATAITTRRAPALGDPGIGPTPTAPGLGGWRRRDAYRAARRIDPTTRRPYGRRPAPGPGERVPCPGRDDAARRGSPHRRPTARPPRHAERHRVRTPTVGSRLWNGRPFQSGASGSLRRWGRPRPGGSAAGAGPARGRSRRGRRRWPRRPGRARPRGPRPRAGRPSPRPRR